MNSNACQHDARHRGPMPGGVEACYLCHAESVRREMIDKGAAVLYLTRNSQTGRRYHVTDWPGRLRFVARKVRTSHPATLSTRRTFHFTGPEGAEWRGEQTGELNGKARCWRT